MANIFTRILRALLTLRQDEKKIIQVVSDGTNVVGGVKQIVNDVQDAGKKAE